MPKITVHGGPTNVRADGPSPAVPADEPLDGAEAVQGRSNDTASEEAAVPGAAPEAEAEAEPQVEVEVEVEAEPEAVAAPDYDAMTLAELKAAAEERGVATYGTKAQIAERLREADQGA